MKHAGRSALRVVSCALLLLGAVRPAAAQSVTGTILGTVTDASGAVVSGVKVTILNEGTALARNVTTDASGEYTAPSLPTGRYTVMSEMAGFKALALSNIDVGVDQRVRIDLKLEVGAMSESVSITAETPLVQTSSSELGTTVGNEQMEALPLNGRNFVNLTRTIPGVLRGIPGANIDGAGSLAWRASASFSANGQRPRDNNYMLDGVDNNETWLQTVVVFPSVDALDEFKLQTSTYSAEFGRSLGGVVNLQIKSGTNQLHGSGFEFLRNDALDANNFFNNKNNRAKPDFKQSQFGGTVGGAVFKDKTFFFADYQGHRETQGQTALSTVPTLAMRNGDFSELNRVIYDPTTNQPFSGNVIPSGRIDTVARNILTQLYPEPNTAGTRQANGQVINNYLLNPIKERQDNQFDVKIDHNLTTNNRFFTRYSFEKTHRLQPASLPHGDAGFTFGAGDGNIKAQSLAFNDTHTLKQNLLNEFRFGWSSIKFLNTSIDYGTNPASAVGLPGINLNEVTSAMSQMTFQNIRNLGANGNQPLITNQNDYQIFDNVTWIKGKHTRQERRQPDPPLARDPQRRLDHRRVQLQQQHDLQLRRPAGRLHGQQRHRLRRRQLHARPRELQEPGAVRRRALQGDPARVRALHPGRLPRHQPADRQSRLAVGRLSAVDRGQRPAVQLRRDHRQVRGRVRRRGDCRGRGGAPPPDLLQA